ncbi:MAG: cbb3-type cytochrome c oxidase subunit II [Bdellovibrionaceae bacterium]|nr:cbb3-type cytochrome c oxidase subunit II [Pseudobdellovibrionaceae bacterium]MDW8190372.1 cbb3-type cytochrome c oxidase subunit II [Pseudobdellovibrionaceae bacterium]
MFRPLGFIIAAAAILGFATVLLVAIPTLQLTQIPAESGLRPYQPLEWEGRRVYISQGCVYCHSQQPRDGSLGPDDRRGWGRASTPGDYVYDYPHLLGTMRTGPDLFNIGVRQPSDDWHHTHLYQPRAVVPWSIMPSYPYLYEWKLKPDPNDFVVKLPPPFAPKEGVIVAKREAVALVAYLKSLKRNYPPTQHQWGKRFKKGD